MKLQIGNYLIESDSLQFIVKEKGKVQESRFTKAENVGKEKEKAIAYLTKFEDALKFIPQEVLRTNDDISIIMDKLSQIQRDIQALDKKPVIIIKTEKENKENE
jgi:hypothetical protein